MGRFTAAPVFSIPLTAPAEGIVERVLVREGSRIAAGVPLAEIRNLALERRATSSRRIVDSLSAVEARSQGFDLRGDLARIRSERGAEETRLGGLRAQLATLTLRAPRSGVIVTRRPEEFTGRWVEPGEPVLEVGQPDSVELLIALSGAGASMVAAGQPVKAVWHADPSLRFSARVTSVSAAAAQSTGAAVEARVRLPSDARWRPGMTGEASIVLRRSNVWGSLWWAIRRRIRSDLFL
ncbi:MAG: HlyD family efflux transporter periplasmic adaptor subunit [Gemmatimonadales bacterium]|nr:HlyD family efflux transporter periplasmic adaptor subunit [Gemmatimonadales bacterium]